MDRSEKIVKIANAYTQTLIEKAPAEALIGKQFWNATDTGIPSHELKCFDDDEAVMSGIGGEETRWKKEDLMLGLAVKETQGFLVDPDRDVDEVIQLMTMKDGHGYGNLTEFYEYV